MIAALAGAALAAVVGLLAPSAAQAATVSHCTAWQQVSTVPGLWQAACLSRDGSYTYASTTITNNGPYVLSITNLKADSSADPTGVYCGAKQLFPGQSFSCASAWKYSGAQTVQGVGRVQYADPIGGGVWWWHVATGWY
jgi:hypothetical protein